MVHLAIWVLVLAAAAPALAQTPPEDQYGPVEITCDNYLELEIPPPELVEECETEVITCASLDQYEIPPADLVENCQQPPPTGPIGPPQDEAKDSIPKAKNAVDQSLKEFSETLSSIRSSNQNEADADETGADNSSPQPEAEPSNSTEFASQSSGSSALTNTSADRKAGDEQSSPERGNENRASGANSENETGAENGSGVAVAEAPDETNLPVTSGTSLIPLGACVLLLAGGLLVARLFR